MVKVLFAFLTKSEGYSLYVEYAVSRLCTPTIRTHIVISIHLVLLYRRDLVTLITIITNRALIDILLCCFRNFYIFRIIFLVIKRFYIFSSADLDQPIAYQT